MLDIRYSHDPNLLLYAMVYRHDPDGVQYVLLDSMADPEWVALSTTDASAAINSAYAIYLPENDERSGYYAESIEPPGTDTQTLQIEIWEQMGSDADRTSDVLLFATETLWDSTAGEEQSETEIHEAILGIQAAVQSIKTSLGTTRLSETDRRLLVRLSNQIQTIRKRA